MVVQKLHSFKSEKVAIILQCHLALASRYFESERMLGPRLFAAPQNKCLGLLVNLIELTRNRTSLLRSNRTANTPHRLPSDDIIHGC